MREQVQPAAVAPLQEASADEVLVELVQRARNAEGDEQRQWCTQVNEALTMPPAEADRGQWAQLVLKLLDDEALHGLVDTRGNSCRRRALEAVMELGFPWALHIEPEDLDFLRASARPSRTGVLLLLVAAVMVVLALAGMFLLVNKPPLIPEFQRGPANRTRSW